VAAIEEFLAHHQQDRRSGSLFQASRSASFELLDFGDMLLLHMQPHGQDVTRSNHGEADGEIKWGAASHHWALPR
jgi:hypothetical protein